MKNYLHILVITAFALMGISPACKFISGQMQSIEICAFDGIKTVQVAANGEEIPADDHFQGPEDCGFCFAQSHLKLAKAEPPAVFVSRDFTHKALISAREFTFSRPELSSIAPRAPPFSLS